MTTKSDIQASNYWWLVRRTASDILLDLGSNKIDELMREIEQLSEEEQIFFYHTDPLDIASEISGKNPSEQQIYDYIKLRDTRYNTGVGRSRIPPNMQDD